MCFNLLAKLYTYCTITKTHLSPKDDHNPQKAASAHRINQFSPPPAASPFHAHGISPFPSPSADTKTQSNWPHSPLL
ncbi:MAG: hypothetical protein NZM37_13095, partial [Sandaracinaceae bacterium]|nr:hypothetical protein [Sandaracinaceae bacterium]